MPQEKTKVAILGTGNIGSDLMVKILNNPGRLELVLFCGIDPDSEGMKRARERGVPTSAEGIQAILKDEEIELVFDATSAHAHVKHAPLLKEAGKTAIDLTPAAVGPYVVPSVNLMERPDLPNYNLITCGGQATIPPVRAVADVVPLDYAEIVSTVSSVSAGPGTRQNIDEFTVTTARGLELVGGAKRGKAIIILNPADPPILMRNTIYLVPAETFLKEAVAEALEKRVREVQAYVPGYRLKGKPVFDQVTIGGAERDRITLLLEVRGAGDFLPEYAGNLDIMTASAWQVGQCIAEFRSG